MDGENNNNFEENLDLFKAYVAGQTQINPNQEEEEEDQVQQQEIQPESQELTDNDIFNAFAVNNKMQGYLSHSQLPEYAPASLGVGDSKLDFMSKGRRRVPHDQQFLTEDQVVNMEEVRGQRQSTGDKWANGILKLLGKTGVQVVGGTVGAVNGLIKGMYDGISDGNWTGFYNNGFANALDDVNEHLDGALPNYYTEAEREMKFWKKLGTANFYSDQLFNGMSFLTGAMLTEALWAKATVLTGGLALPGLTSATARNIAGVKRVLKGIDRTADSKKVKAALQTYKNKQRTKEALTLARQLYTGAGYEAGVEARAHYKHLKESLIAEQNLKNELEGKGPITQEQMLEIENMARAHSNAVFAAQLPLVGVGNMLMLSKLYGPGKNLQKAVRDRIRRVNPNFMRPVTVTDQGAKAAYKSNKALKFLGAGEKTIENLNKVGSRTKAVLGTPIYEGFVEEGGQKVIDLTSYDYALAKFSGDGTKNTSSIIESFYRGLEDTYTTDDGLTEVMMGFILGMIGIPGLKGANQGGLVAVHGRLKNVVKNEAIQEKVAKFYNDNKDLFSALKSNSEFANEMYVLNALQDRALADGNDAQWKNIENDKIFSYVKAKLTTGQFEDIAEDANAVRKMSNDEFIEFFGYDKQDFKDENAIAKRKNEVADSIIKRAQKIKEAFDTVDSLKDWDLSEDNNGIIRDQLTHALATIDNVQERKAKLTAMLGELTNGKVNGSKITYTNHLGEKVEFDLESFSENSMRSEYKLLKEVLEKNEKADEGSKLSPEELKKYTDRLDYLKQVINSQTGPVDFTNLSQEEQKLYNAVVPHLQDLHKDSPQKAIIDSQEKIIGLLKDLRHLRGRSQEFIQKFNELAYDKQARKQEIQRISDYAEDSKKESIAGEFLQGKAKDLYLKYGSSAVFTTEEDGVEKNYRFLDNGDVVEDGTTTVVNPSVLDKVKYIKDDRVSDAKKALKAIEELKSEKGIEAEKVAEEIAKLEKEVSDLLKSIADGKSAKIGGLVKSVAEVNKMIKKAKRTINKLEKQAFRIQEQQTYLDNFIRQYYDPTTDRLKGTLTEIGKALEKFTDKILLNMEELSEKDMTNVDRLERKVNKIMSPVRQWLTQNTKSVQLIAQKLQELRNTRNNLYKVLFDRLREQNPKLLLSYDSNNFEELYLDILNEIRIAVESLEKTKSEKNKPLKGLEKEHRQTLKELPIMKRQLETLLNNPELSSYEGYLEFISTKPNSFALLNDLGLNKLSAIEQALQDSRFASAELNATQSEIAQLTQIINDIAALDKEGGASAQASLAAQIIEHAKLQEAFNEMLKHMAEVENAVKEVADPPSPVREEPPSSNTPDNNPSNENTDYEQLAGPSWFPDISTGFGHLTGDVNNNKAVIDKYAQTDEEGNIDYTNVQPKKGLNKFELNSFRNAKRMLNAFNFFSHLKFKQFEKGSNNYLFMPITHADQFVSDPAYFKGSFKRDTPDSNQMWQDEGDTTNPMKQAVHLILIDKDTKEPIIHNGEIVYMPLRDAVYPAWDQKEFEKNPNSLFKVQEQFFTNDNGLSPSAITQIINDYTELRTEILNGNHKFLKFTGVTRGFYPGKEMKKTDPQPVHGRGVPLNQPLSEAKVEIVTEQADADGLAPISLLDGGKTGRIKRGQVYINLGGQIIYLERRNISSSEADLIVQLLRKYETNFKKIIDAAKDNKKDSRISKAIYEQAGQTARKQGVESINGDLLHLVQDITEMGKNTLKGEFPFSFTSLNNTSGYQFGDNFITSQELIDANPEKIVALKEFLRSKPVHALNMKLDKKQTKHFVPKFNDQLELINTTEYTNYEEYLLAERPGETAQETQPMFMTRHPLISNNIYAPSFISVYPKFSVGPGFKTSDKEVIKKESIDPKNPVDTQLSLFEESDVLEKLKEEHKKALKEGNTELANELEKNINSLEAAENSLAGRGTRFSKKKQDANVDDILNKAKQHREENDESEVNMVFTEASEINEDLQKEISKAKKMLPKTEFKVVEGFINGNAKGIVGQLRGQGNILLSNIGPSGVAYHEAFHQVSYFLLPDVARERMYAEVRNAEGSIRTYKGEVKDRSKLSDKEVEEYLAEEFRQWILSNGEYKKDIYSAKTKKGFFARLFQKIKTILKGLLGLNDRFEIDPTMAVVANVFQAIEGGKFADTNPIQNRNTDIVANMALLPNTDATRSQEIVDVVTNYFSHELFYGPESSLNIHDIELLTTPEKKKDFTEKINKAYNAAFIKMLEGLALRYKSLEGNPLEQSKIHSDIRYIQTHEKQIKDVHRLWLNTIGLNFTLEYDMVKEENARGKQAYNIFNSNEFSSVTTARPAIKILVGTLPDTGKVNSLGLVPAVDFRDSMNYLHEHLNGITDRHAQIRKLQSLTGKQPWIKELINRLGDLSSEETSLSDLKLQVGFWQQFSQPKNNFNIQLISKNSNATINVRTSDANKVQRHNDIKSRWKANLISKVSFEDKALVKLVNDKVVLNLSAPILFPSKNKKFSIRKLKQNKRFLDAETSLEFLGALGINFTDRDAMLDGQSGILIDGQSIPIILQNTARRIIDLLDIENPIANMFDSDIVDAQSRLSKVVEAELKFRDDIHELRHRGADNKNRYGIGLPTHVDQVADKLNQGIIPAHLQPENNPYTANSILIKAILNGKYPKIKVTHIEGLRINRPGQTGLLTSEASRASRLSIYVNNVLRGVHPLFRTGDSKQERALDLGPQSIVKNYAAAHEILLGYVRDEINTVRENRINKYGADIATYQKQGSELRIFKGIFKNADETFLNDLEETLDGQKSVDEFFALHEGNMHPTTSETNPTTILSLIKEYLDAETVKVTEMLVQHKALKRATKDSPYFTNNLLSEDLMKTFLPTKKTLAWSQSDVDTVIGAFVLNDFIGSMEQFKLIFGDPANYQKKDFFKRTKLAVGAKRLALVDPHINNLLNSTYPRKDGKKMDGTARIMVFEEPITSSLYFENYSMFGVKNSEDYLVMKEADGHAFANMHFYRELLIRTSDWTTSQEEIYQQMFDDSGNPTGVTFSNEILASFPTIKPQYFGPQNINGKPSLPFSLKFSLTPILPSITFATDGSLRANELNKLMYNMQNKDNVTDMVLFPSSAKLGHKVNDKGEAPPLYSSKQGALSLLGQMNNIPVDGHNIINLEHFGIQLDVSQKYKQEVSKGTQPVVLVLSDLATSADPEMQLKINEYINLLNINTQNDFQALLDRFGVTRTQKGFKIKDKLKFIQLIREESIKRKYPENIAQGINALLTKETDYQKLDALVNKSDIERLLYSLLDSQVIRKKFKGDLRVQQSSLGYNTQSRAVEQDENGNIKLLNRTLTGYETLKFYNKNPQDNTVSSMEVYMPHFFQEYLGGGENLTIKDGDEGYGIYNGDKLVGDPDLLDVIGFRIPTDDFHSIDFITIKGFLPPEAGPVVVVPPELTVKVGMDFDIDKFNLYFPSYRITVTGKIIKRQFIDGDTNLNETLREFYDALYKPTLDFFTYIDRELEEIDIELELGQREAPLTDVSVDKMIQAIFGDDAITDLGGYTADEVDVILKAFKQYDSAYLPTKFKDVSSYAIEKYQELRERIGEIPSFETWAEENRGKPAAKLNHPGAVQNKIMELQKYFLSHPDNFEKLVAPTSTDGAKETADLIRTLKGESENTNLDWSDIISFDNKQKAAHRMWAGLDALGIFAVNNTHHVKSQLANLELPQTKALVSGGRAFDPRLFVKGLEYNNGIISYGRITDLEGNNIKDTLSQLLNAAADVTKDPFLFDLNITPETANVAMALIRGGVPLRWTAFFLNQPIILRYLELKSINNNPILKEVGTLEYESQLIKQIKQEFTGIDSKISPKDIEVYIGEDQLQEMINLDTETIQRDHDEMGVKNPNASLLNLQLQILKNFRSYEKLGAELGDLTNYLNFDTKPPLNRNDAELRARRANKIVKGTGFLNANNIITNTHLHSLAEVIGDSRYIFNDLFEISASKIYADTRIYDIIAKLNLPQKDALNILETYENDLVTALLTKETGLESKINGLLFGPESLANRIYKLKSDPQYKNNKFLNDLLPLIRTDRKNTDNLKYYSMLKSTFEKNVSRDSFFALPLNIQEDIIDLAILQGGLNYSDVSLLRLVPNEIYINKALKFIRSVKDYNDNGKNDIIKKFNDLFFRNNWNNRKLVPQVTSNEFFNMKTGKFNRYSNYPYIVHMYKVMGETKTDLYKQTGNKANPFSLVNKLGNGKFFKEYLSSNLVGRDQIRSILAENNIDRKSEGIAVNVAQPTPLSKEEMNKQAETLGQQDANDSLVC